MATKPPTSNLLFILCLMSKKGAWWSSIRRENAGGSLSILHFMFLQIISLLNPHWSLLNSPFSWTFTNPNDQRETWKNPLMGRELQPSRRGAWLNPSLFMPKSPTCPGFEDLHMGMSLNGGTPIAGWFIVENANLKWMMTGGYPISGNFHMLFVVQSNLKGTSLCH